MSFEHHLKARFYEVDRAGIIFFGRFYEYCHAALEELLEAMFGHPASIFETHGFGMPLVHSEADYKRPTRMGDNLRITVDVERVGAKSITFHYVVYGDQDDRRCDVRLIHCFVDLATFDAIAMPDVFLDGLKKVGLS